MPQHRAAVRRWAAALVALLALVAALAVPGPAGSVTPTQATATAALTGTAAPGAADHLRNKPDLRRGPAAGPVAILGAPPCAATPLGRLAAVVVRAGAGAGVKARTGCSERAPPSGSV